MSIPCPKIELLFMDEVEYENKPDIPEEYRVTPYSRGLNGQKLTAYLLTIPFDQYDDEKSIYLIYEEWERSPKNEYPADYGREICFIPLQRLWGAPRNNPHKVPEVLWEDIKGNVWSMSLHLQIEDMINKLNKHIALLR